MDDWLKRGVLAKSTPVSVCYDQILKTDGPRVLTAEIENPPSSKQFIGVFPMTVLVYATSVNHGRSDRDDVAATR